MFDIARIASELNISIEILQVAFNIANVESSFIFNAATPPPDTAYGPFQYNDAGWQTGWTRLFRDQDDLGIQIPANLNAANTRFDLDWQIRVALNEFRIYNDGYPEVINADWQDRVDALVLRGFEPDVNFLQYAYLRHNTDGLPGGQVERVYVRDFTDTTVLTFNALAKTISYLTEFTNMDGRVTDITVDNVFANSPIVDITFNNQNTDFFDGNNAPQTIQFDTNDEFFIVQYANGDIKNFVFVRDDMSRAGTNGNDVIEGTSGDQIFFASAGNDEIDGRGGFDTVDYRNAPDGIEADIFLGTVTVRKPNFETDVLTLIEAIEGTAFSDTFYIFGFQPGRTITINGNSNVPIIPQRDYDRDIAFAAGNGPQHMADGTEDFLFIDQALRDAGAAITYMSDDGSGIVWIEEGGVTQRVLYTGIFHLPQQDPDDFFWGTSGLGDVGGWVGIGDTGSVMVDLSGVTQDIDMSTFSGVSLWNLADDIVTGSGDVTLDLGFIGLDSFTGGSGDDTITGGATDDVFVGNLGNDSFFGNDGDDVLNGGGGADILDGGAGNDTASYEDSPNRVLINLLADTASSGHAAGDTLISIENLIGTEFGDNLRGDFGANIIQGGNGQDTLIGYNGDDALYGGDADDAINGGTGADLIDGGAGFDQARYNGSTAAVQIDLGAGTAFGGSAQGDTLINIEAVFGSLFNDTITGDAGNNYLYGSGGDDILASGGGIDKFFGGSGADSFVLGEGFAYVTDFEDNIDQLDVSAYGFNSLNDALANLDQVGDHARFRVGDDTLLVLFTDMNDLMDDIVFDSGGV